LRLQYPRWIFFGDDLAPRDLDEASGSIAAFSAQIEVHKMLGIARYISSGIDSWDYIASGVGMLSRDAQHISMLSIFGDPLRPIARGSNDLDYALGSISEIRDPGLLVTLTAVTVLPAYVSILEFISRRTPIQRIREILSSIAEQEARDIDAIATMISGRYREDDVAKTIEERAVILFASAAAEESMKIAIASVALGQHVQISRAQEVLRELYSSIDERRVATARKIFGDSDRLITIIRKYGLSGIGLC